MNKLSSLLKKRLWHQEALLVPSNDERHGGGLTMAYAAQKINHKEIAGSRDGTGTNPFCIIERKNITPPKVFCVDGQSRRATRGPRATANHESEAIG